MRSRACLLRNTMMQLRARTAKILEVVPRRSPSPSGRGIKGEGENAGLAGAFEHPEAAGLATRSPSPRPLPLGEGESPPAPEVLTLCCACGGSRVGFRSVHSCLTSFPLRVSDLPLPDDPPDASRLLCGNNLQLPSVAPAVRKCGPGTSGNYRIPSAGRAGRR
jgi:hypothetical protein